MSVVALQNVVLREYFKEDINKGIGIFLGGKLDTTIAQLTDEDKFAFDVAWNQLIRNLQKVAPQAVPDIAAQYNTFLKWAQIAKAILPSTGGILPLAYPSRDGAIGVYPIFPQAIKYPSVSGYNSPVTLYDGNTWDILLTKPAAAGTDVGDFIFGSATAFYKTSNAPNKKQLMVIAQNGFLEIGPTPNIVQYQVFGQAEPGKYSFFVASPIQDVSSDPRRPVYIYETPYQIPIWYDFGIKLRVVSKATYKASLRIIGLVFFEHGLFPTTTWV
jgi:hypothetical protein